MIREINIDKLRTNLLNYFGTAMFNSSPLAIIELTKIERASDEEIIRIALNNNFDLNKYKYNSRSRY